MSKRKIETIEISDSDDNTQDEEDQVVPLQRIDPSMVPEIRGDGAQEAPPVPSTSTSNTAADFLRDRKRLEAERLERQAKHVRADSNTQPPQQQQQQQQQRVRSNGVVKYPDGVVKQTVNYLTDRNEDAWTINKCFGPPEQLKMVVMSSYVRDSDFVEPLFGNAKVVVAQPSKLADPPMNRNWYMHNVDARGTYHAKFAIMFTTDGWMRVMVTTANFIKMDWMFNENTIFLQDFPPKGNTLDGSSSNQTPDFLSDLTWFLYKLRLNEVLERLAGDVDDMPFPNVNTLRQWDFSRSKARLVASINGEHSGVENIKRVGHPRLADLIRNAGCGIDANNDLINPRGDSAKHEWFVDVECQGSSLGAYKVDWGREFYNSACGRFNLIKGQQDDALALKSKKRKENKKVWPPIKILFPSKRMADSNYGGQQMGGNMFMDARKWLAPEFPRHAVYKNPSKRGPIFMHAKSICGILKHKHTVSKSKLAGKVKKAEDGQDKVTFTSDEESDSSATESEADASERATEKDVAGGWVYIGSHNFTPSAWGRLTKAGKLSITNWELGVFLPLYGDDKVCNALADEYLTYKRPAEKYSNTDVPWMFTNWRINNNYDAELIRSTRDMDLFD